MKRAAVAPAAPAPASARIEGLDGLRALAIALVVLFHLNLLGVGWIGVQLFFVLSGFLITRLLLALRDGRSLRDYLRTFYGRRVLRIFPIYYLYLLVLVVAALLWWRDSAPAQRALEQAPAAFLYLYNWQAMLPGHERTFFLTHFWTLAIEEQFYLVWPFLVYRMALPRLRQVLIALVLAGPLLRFAIFLLWPLTPPRIYDAVAICTISQLDAFALGALLNFMTAGPRLHARPGLWIALAVVIAYLLGASVSGFGIAPAGAFATPLTLGYPNLLAHWFQFTWGYSAINLVCALLIAAVAYAGFAQRATRFAPVQYLGRISYGVYVLHFPLAHLCAPLLRQLSEVVGAGPIIGTLIGMPLYLIVLIGLSAASFELYERRFLRLKERFFPV